MSHKNTFTRQGVLKQRPSVVVFHEPIVRIVALARCPFGRPYHSEVTFRKPVWSHGGFQSKHRCLGDLWAAKGVEWTCSCEIHEWVWGHVESQHWRSREFLGWDGEAILLANTFWKGGPWVQLWSQSRSNLSEMVSGRQDQLILQLFGSKYWTRSGI